MPKEWKREGGREGKGGWDLRGYWEEGRVLNSRGRKCVSGSE